MKEQIISYETAVLAKKKGFREPTIDMYYKSNTHFELHKGSVSHTRYTNCSKLYHGSDTCDYEESRVYVDDLYKQVEDYPAKNMLFQAPTQSVLQKWLREIHGIVVLVQLDLIYTTYGVQIKFHPNCKFKSDTITKFAYGGSYEENLELGLQEGLKLIKWLNL